MVVLSKASVGSQWLAKEIDRAYAAEQSRDEIVLVPICIDDAATALDERGAFNRYYRRSVADFRSWNNNAEYLDSFNRLLSQLQISAFPPGVS